MTAPIDLFALSGGAPSIHTPATHAEVVDVSSTDYVPTNVCTEIRAAGAGVVTVDTQGGETNIAVPISAGLPLRLRVLKVYKTGTTATGIVLLT